MICRRISAPLNDADQVLCGIGPRASYAAVSAGSCTTARYGHPSLHCQVMPTFSASSTQPTFSVIPPSDAEYSARIGAPAYVRINEGVEATAAVVRALSFERPP